jgi:hypothetical protein
LLDAEMPASHWLAGVVGDLKGQYFDEAAEQIGVDVTNRHLAKISYWFRALGRGYNSTRRGTYPA